MRVFISLVILVLTGCLHEQSETCRNGSLCPPGLLCIDTANTTAGGRICTAGTCGNGVLDPGEVCDDGNNHSGDGCPADCSQPCGDGVLDPGEVCDDGNNLDGDGCSADCKSRDGVFLVSPSTVAFAIDEGDPAPGDIAVTVQLGKHTDTVAVDDDAAGPLPSWLAITETSIASDTVALRLHVTDATTLGLRSAVIHLTVDHADGSADGVELPVSYLIQASDLAVQAEPTTLAFTAAVGDPSVPSQAVTVTFNGDDLRVASAPAWLTVSSATPTTLDVAVATTALAAGTTLAGDVVLTTSRGPVERTAKIHATYDVVTPNALAITPAPNALAFTAYAGGAPPAAQAVTVTFDGASVELVSAPTWLTVASPVDRTTSPAMFALAANTTAFAAGATQTDAVVIRTTKNQVHQDVSVPITYQVLAPPTLGFVSPYVGYSGRAAILSVNGTGFQPGVPIVIGVGDLRFPVVPTSSVQVAIAYPALAEGRYPVTLIDPPASPSDSALVIVAPPRFVYQALDVSGAWTRLVYDAERQAIYAANPAAQQIVRFAYVNGAWAAQPPLAVANLTDIAPTPDGRSLIAVDTAAINELALADGTFAPTRLVPRPEATCNLFEVAALASNGKVFVSSSITGSGFCPAYIYDLLARSLVAIDSFASGIPVASGNRNRVFVCSGGFPDQPLLIYDTSVDRLSLSTSGDLNLCPTSIDDIASRMIASDTQVYDGAFRRIGNVPYHGPSTTAVTHDGTRAFIYAQDPPGPRLEVYDLHGPLQTGAMFPLIATLPLADAVNGANVYAMAVTITPDDAVVFIAGATKLLVVPVR